MDKSKTYYWNGEKTAPYYIKSIRKIENVTVIIFVSESSGAKYAMDEKTFKESFVMEDTK